MAYSILSQNQVGGIPPTRSSHCEHSALRALCSCTRQELTRALKD